MNDGLPAVLPIKTHRFRTENNNKDKKWSFAPMLYFYSSLFWGEQNCAYKSHQDQPNGFLWIQMDLNGLFKSVTMSVSGLTESMFTFAIITVAIFTLHASITVLLSCKMKKKISLNNLKMSQWLSVFIKVDNEKGHDLTSRYFLFLFSKKESLIRSFWDFLE